MEISEKSEQIKALQGGNGIQSLLSEAYKLLGNPILIHDMDYKIIDFNKNVVTDDPIWNEYVTKGKVGYEWLDFFKKECFLEAAANTKKMTFLKSDKLKYDRIYGKIFNKNSIQIGCAILMASDRPFESDDPTCFEDFCTILSEEIGTIDYYNEYGQVYFEKLVDELIVGIHDITLYIAHVESIYMHLKANLYLAVVDIGKCDPTYSQLAHFRDLFKKTQPEYAYAISSNYIVIIIGIDDRFLYVEKNLNRLNQLFLENSIDAGISSSFENLFELGKYYKQALDALNNGRGITDQHIFLYEQLNEFNHDQNP